MTKKNTYTQKCNVAQSLNLIGDRWTLLIIRDLLLGKSTFNELKSSLEGISSNMLSERLQSLIEADILYSNLYSVHPPRYEYKLTERGAALRKVIDAIGIWGNTYLDEKYTTIQHKACGTPVEMTYYCPQCRKITDDLDVVPKER